jgi:hypothetical protein
MQSAFFGIMIMGGQEIFISGFFSKNKCAKSCDEGQIFTL